MKKIKRFFIANIILSFFLIGNLYCLSWIWKNYADEMSVKFLEFEKKNIKNLKVVNVGSSHTTYGIKYSKEIKGYNLGLPSQKFYYDFEILKRYYKRFDNNCIVIIPISIFSFYVCDEAIETSKNYIQFLEHRTLLGISKQEYILGKYFSITQPLSRIPQILQFFINSVKNGKLEKKNIIYRKNISFEEKQKAAIETAVGHLRINSIQDRNIGIKQLIDILNFCEEKGLRPVLISTPQTYLYNEQIGEKNYQVRIYNNIKKIEKKQSKKYLYLDYSHDKRFVNNLEYFSDDDHLNEKGAEYFTKILLEDLKNKGYDFN